MDAKLEIRRSNADAKCANCGWWQGAGGSYGLCGNADTKTLDLAVCTSWRTADITQTIMPPELDE